MSRIQIKHFILYVAVAVLMTHELDAVMNNEWLVLPLTSWLEPEMGYVVFLWFHVPLFAIIMALLASENQKLKTMTACSLSSFLVIHAILHMSFSGHVHYEFSSLSSHLLIYGGGLLGVLHLVLEYKETGQRA